MFFSAKKGVHDSIYSRQRGAKNVGGQSRIANLLWQKTLRNARSRENPIQTGLADFVSSASDFPLLAWAATLRRSAFKRMNPEASSWR